MPVAVWKRTSAVALMMGALVGACGDDDGDKSQNQADAGLDGAVRNDSSQPPPDTQGDSGSPIDLADAGMDASVPSGPIVLQWQFYTTDEDYFNYLNVFPDLDKSRSVDMGQGTEVRDNGDAQVYKGVVYWAKREQGTITKYERDATGKLVPGDFVNFSGLGLTDASGFLIVSDTKGYVFDADGLKLLKFNPSTMKIIEGATDLSTVERDGFNHYLCTDAFEAHVRGNHLYVPVAWYSPQQRGFRDAAGVLVIDINTDQVVNMIDDPRCTGIYNALEVPNGDIYLFQALNSSALTMVTKQQPSCALRINAGQDTTDSSYLLNLSALVGGRAVQGAIPDKKGGFYVKAFYSDRATSSDPADVYEASGYSNWRHWHYNPATNAATEISVTPWDSMSTRWYDLGDGRIFTPAVEYDQASGKYKTTYFEITNDVQPTQRISVNGWSETVGIIK